jgi:secreted trypsin-like serine protease
MKKKQYFSLLHRHLSSKLDVLVRNCCFQGDSGGSLNCPENNGGYYMAGITSWGVVNFVNGVATCNVFYPSVYTAVSKYLDWIAQHKQATGS